MCGISGIVSSEGVSLPLLTAIRDTMVHRGPDGCGNYISDCGKVGLSHRRLSIVELTELGAQPMVSHCDRYVITYNGEVYNHKELRNELVELGVVFKGNSDTEVVLNAYAVWREHCLQKFNGMFSFAIYDKEQETLFLARDRFGIKPLYYVFLDTGDFVFASELKAICAHPKFKREINKEAVLDYFRYRYIPSPKTIWKSSYKLPQSHYAIYDFKTSSFEVKKYYDLEKIVQNKSSSINDVEKKLSSAVSMQLEADVEVGAFLSGGLDSSSITALALEYHKKIKTFSIGFSPEEFSELKYSKQVSDYLGIHHEYQVLDHIEKEILEHFSDIYDEPLADSSCIPTISLCKMTSKHLKVVLSGDGGDEVFSGYNWYSSYLKDYTSFKNTVINKLISLFGGKDINDIRCFENYYSNLLLGRFDHSVFEKMFSADFYNEVKNYRGDIFNSSLNRKNKSVRAIQFVDLNTFLPDDILVKVDRASMAYSLETRVPMLDHELVESVLSLDECDFPSSSTGKPILKKIVKGRLPEDIFTRDKKGFSAPVTQWEITQNMFSSLPFGILVEENIILKQYIEDLLTKEDDKSKAMLWMIYILENWCLKWLK